MKISQSNNLRAEDFPDQSAWIGRLFIILNSFITSVNQVIDQNIDFATNIKSVTKDYDVSSLTYPIKFQWAFPQAAPISLVICKAMKDGVATNLLPAWTYNASTQEITITYLSECLSTGTIGATSIGPRYKFTVRATV